jgi:hypothetical protein
MMSANPDYGAQYLLFYTLAILNNKEKHVPAYRAMELRMVFDLLMPTMIW